MATLKQTQKTISTALINLDIDFTKRGNRFIISDYFSITIEQGDNVVEVFYFDSLKDKDFLSTEETVKNATETINEFLKK